MGSGGNPMALFSQLFGYTLVVGFAPPAVACLLPEGLLSVPRRFIFSDQFCFGLFRGHNSPLTWRSWPRKRRCSLAFIGRGRRNGWEPGCSLVYVFKFPLFYRNDKCSSGVSVSFPLSRFFRTHSQPPRGFPIMSWGEAVSPFGLSPLCFPSETFRIPLPSFRHLHPQPLCEPCNRSPCP